MSGIRETPAPALRKFKRGKPYRTSWPVFGILNPYGDIWTSETFKSESAALDYLKSYWADFPAQCADLSRFKVIPVKVTVSDAREEATE